MEFAKNSITLSSSLADSRAGLRPASEMDSVMEFGFNYPLFITFKAYVTVVIMS